MAGLVPAIHAVRRNAIVLKGGGLSRVSYGTMPVNPRVRRETATWMAGTSPAMTQRASARHQMTSAPIAVIDGVPISFSEALGAGFVAAWLLLAC